MNGATVVQLVLRFWWLVLLAIIGLWGAWLSFWGGSAAVFVNCLLAGLCLWTRPPFRSATPPAS